VRGISPHLSLWGTRHPRFRNGVYFVGARESWYPHLGDASDFSLYEMTMRWPRRLRLAATGTKLDEKEDVTFTSATGKPIRPQP